MAGNLAWLSLVHSSPGLCQSFRILCSQCHGISEVGAEGPIGHQPSVPTGFPWKLHFPLFPGSFGSRDCLLGPCHTQDKRSFFWGYLKARVPGVPTQSFSRIRTFPGWLGWRERPSSNFSLHLLPPVSLEKSPAWERRAISHDSALNPPSSFEFLRLSYPKGFVHLILVSVEYLHF